MSTDTSTEMVPVEEKPEDPMLIKIRAQFAMSAAVRNYLDAEEKFENANAAYGESCRAVRAMLKPDTRIVVRLEYGKHCLLTSNDEGNFEVSDIEVI